jgi:hypothetical protein
LLYFKKKIPNAKIRLPTQFRDNTNMAKNKNNKSNKKESFQSTRVTQRTKFTSQLGRRTKLDKSYVD